ncbi:TPA: CRISPR-associated endoribonuclease Cas6 [Streptococcus suis]|nr:CRISPR-associated endoribonuclease Cas6 [Streptococcus suis]
MKKLFAIDIIIEVIFGREGGNMRFRVDVDLNGNSLVLPIHYQQLIQGILYHAMPRLAADKAHYQAKGVRNLPLFTFSQLFGDFSKDDKKGTLLFSKLYFYVSFKDEVLGYEVVKQMMKGIDFYGEPYACHIHLLPAYSKGHWIDTLSPILVRRTDPATKKVTFFKPNTVDFTLAIYNNLKRKYFHYYGKEYVGEFALSAIPETIESVSVRYKNTYLKGYSGKFYLIASPQAMEILYDMGLGEKNAQGFGMFRMEEEDV